jgi:hypothetical protein
MYLDGTCATPFRMAPTTKALSADRIFPAEVCGETVIPSSARAEYHSMVGTQENEMIRTLSIRSIKEYAARVRCGFLLSAVAFSFGLMQSCLAMTRVESVPIGIPGSGGALGTAVALYGDTAVVGAPLSQPAPYVGSGSVDIYRHVGADWQREAVLLPADAAADMEFGSRLALGADLLVVATTGQSGTTAAVYTFSRSGTSWQQVDRFAANASVSLSGNTLALGSGGIFVRAGAGWSQQAQLTAEVGEVFNLADVDGDFVLAWTSAYVNNFEIHNYAYLFHRTGTAWAREARIELGLSGVFDAPQPAFSLSAQTALVSWRNIVTSYTRESGGNWSSQGILDPLTSAPGFGVGVALEGDRALVSSPGDTVYGWNSAGTVYVFERSGGIWTREAHVAHSTVNYYNYYFGASVALEGDTMLVGAPGAYTDAGATGDATVLTESGGAWAPTAVLDPGNDHRGEDFGAAVALSGSTLLVGADEAATSSLFFTGVAYIFDSANGGWTEHARLTPSVPYCYGFGSAVALDQDTAVVGVNGTLGATDDVGGAVYVFVRGDGTWPQQARLASGAPDGAQVGFGSAVAIQGDLLAAGEAGSSNTPMHGSVRMFQRSGTMWSPQAIVEASDGSNNDGFGSSIALVGDTLAVGAPSADVGIETDAGAVYVFTNTGGVWSQQAIVTAPIASKLAGFGKSVAVAGGTLVVGSTDGTSRSAAYVYTLVGGNWTLQTRLTPTDDASVSGTYGSSVAISGAADRIVVGQPSGPSAAPNGRAFVFNLTGGDWLPASELTGTTAPPPSYGGDGFGKSVAMSGEKVVVGAPRDGRGGAAYLADVGNVVFDDGFEGD